MVRVRPKILYLFPEYLFKVTKKVKNGYYRNGGLSFAWDLGVSFLGWRELRN